MADQLPEPARTTLLHAARTMFPHPGLPDAAYENVLTTLEAEPENHPTLTEGVTRLDDPRPFSGLAEDERLDALRREEGSPFFALVHSTAVVALYDQPMVWEAFGYEGPSVHLGGYLRRGFDDLDWLPEPPILIDWDDATTGSTA